MKVKKLLDKYNNIPLPAKASMWFVVANVIQKGISLITTPIFTRLLTTDQYGIYSVYQSWSSILLIIFTLNLYVGYFSNRLIHEFEKKEQMSSLTLGLSNAVTIFFFALYVCAVDFWNGILGLSTFFVLLIFAESFFLPAYNIWMGIQRFQFQYRKMIVVSTIIAVTSPLIGVISVLNTEYKAEARVAAFAVVHVLISIYFYTMILSRGKKVFEREYWFQGIKFNLPLIPHWLSLNILGSLDRIMIQRMIGNSEAAIYSVSYMVSSMFNLVINGLNQALTPYTYRKLKERQYANIKRNSAFLMILIFAGCIVAMSFGPELVKIFASPTYYEARWIIPSVASSVFFSFQYNLFSIVEFYYAKTKGIMVASCLAAILNVVLNLFAIPVFGYIGAAYTTLISYAFLAVVHAILSCRILRSKKIRVKDVYNLKLAFIMSILICIIMVAIIPIYDILAIRYVIIGILLIGGVIKRKLIIKKLKELKDK